MGENVNDILTNGFDSEKISSTEYGPGVYFGGSEGAVQIYSGVTLFAEYEGVTANGKKLNECNDLSSDIMNLIMEYLNIQIDFTSMTCLDEIEVLRKFANEYIRTKIVDELGIDGANANNPENYFIVFNPKVIKNIKMLHINRII